VSIQYTGSPVDTLAPDTHPGDFETCGTARVNKDLFTSESFDLILPRYVPLIAHDSKQDSTLTRSLEPATRRITSTPEKTPRKWQRK